MVERHSGSLPALDTGLPIGYRGCGMSTTGHEGEDSGFESPQLRFSFWSLYLYLEEEGAGYCSCAAECSLSS